jgi:hypothetical protein
VREEYRNKVGSQKRRDKTVPCKHDLYPKWLETNKDYPLMVQGFYTLKRNLACPQTPPTSPTKRRGYKKSGVHFTCKRKEDCIESPTFDPEVNDKLI